MKTPYSMTPDYTPVFKMMAMQTQMAFETSQKMMQLAMLPWKGVPTPFGLFKAQLSVTSPSAAETLPEAPATVKKAVDDAARTAEAAVEAVSSRVEEPAEATEEVATETVETVEAAVDEAPEVVETVAEPVEEAVEEVAEEALELADATVAPMKLDAPKGEADDLTVLSGVGPKLAEALNEAGIYHLDQIAAWTEANVAWVDEYLPGVRGRASRNGWVAQAADLLQ